MTSLGIAFNRHLPLLLAQTESSESTLLSTLLLAPLFWALLLGTAGIWLAICGPTKWPRRCGMLLAIAGLLLLGSQLPRVAGTGWEAWLEQGVFWLLAGLAVISAGAVILVRSPVYSAVWFAVTLLAVSGLLLVQGAQFLGVATLAVYAGAILVTFLFVLMLAQPEGFAFYDRLSWGSGPVAVAIAASLSLVVGTTYLVAGQQPLDGGPRQGGFQPTLRDQVESALPEVADDDAIRLGRDQLLAARFTRPQGATTDILMLDVIPPNDLSLEEQADWANTVGMQLMPVAAENLDLNPAKFVVHINTSENVRAEQHVARLGGNLFSRHLISIQVAGALLLAALVGAVAICMQGGDRRD